MSIKTYYYRRFVRIQSDDRRVQESIDNAIRQSTTFLYCPLRVRHDLYENEEIREACGFYTRDQVSVILQTSSRPKDLSSILGKLNVRLERPQETDPKDKKKTIRLYFVRVKTSIDAAAQRILEISTVIHKDKEWQITACTGGGERVRYVTEENRENTLSSRSASIPEERNAAGIANRLTEI
jgi:hypothetical protein